MIAVIILFSLNWQLALTALAIIPGVMLISFASARRVRPIYRSLRKDAEEIDGRVGETFSGIRVVRAFGREIRELREYMHGRHAVLRKELFAHRRELVIWGAWGLLIGGVNVVIVWYGGYLNLSGRASIGDIMAFQWYTFLLLNPVWNIVNSFSELQRALAAMERVFEVLELDRDKPDRPGAHDAPAVVHEVRFEEVEFEYREGRPVVREFNVAVPGGSVVALVGRSGAGKTTVTDLVARFHDPTQGRILLNGEDIRDFRLATYRRLLALVQQDVFLFDGSVRDNIAYGRHDASDAEVEDAARRANAHEFIERLPEGYQTFVGERGVKLSGGQQQRLAIARAMLASPQILILDEATSNLDTESEQLIQASMASLLAGRTTFVIAHRLSTIRRADLILLMEDGRIVERGTHDELMAAGGLYSEMVLRQMASHGHEDEPVLRATPEAGRAGSGQAVGRRELQMLRIVRPGLTVAAAVAAGAMLSAQNPPQGQPTFRGGANVVRVDLFAMRDGNVVDDLQGVRGRGARGRRQADDRELRARRACARRWRRSCAPSRTASPRAGRWRPIRAPASSSSFSTPITRRRSTRRACASRCCSSSTASSARTICWR